MNSFFLSIYSFATKNRWTATGIFLSILIVFGFFSSKISFEENITNLIPKNDQSNISAKVLSQLNFADKITIVISAEKDAGPDDVTQFATTFLDSLTTSCSPYISKIQGKIEDNNIQETYDFVYQNLPLFLDSADYRQIQNKIQNDSVASSVAADYKSLISPTGIVTKDFILKDPLGISFIALKKLQQMSVGNDFDLQNGFVVTKDKKKLLLFITSKLPANETDKNTLFIARLNNIKNALNTQYLHRASLSYFGSTPVAVANATQIKADVKHTSIFAVVALIIILTFFYRSLLTPIIIFIPSLFGAVFSLGLLYFFKGSISAISLGISSILLGETTDYSIYVLTHYRNNKDVKLLYKDISKPLIMCGITTAITFLCLFFVKSESLKDLAIFASISVFSTTLFSLLLIPLLYKPKGTPTVAPKQNIIDKLAAYCYHKNKYLVIVVLVFFVLSLFTRHNVGFNNDLSALNFVPADIQKAEHDLESIANISSTSVYVAVYGDNYDAVLKTNTTLFNRLKHEEMSGEIVDFSSIGGIVFSQESQREKIAAWNDFWSTEKKTELKNKLIFNGNKFGFKSTSFQDFYSMLDQQFNTLSIKEYANIKSLFLDEFVAEKKGFYTITTLVKVPADKRDAFVNGLKNNSGILVIDRKQMNESFLGSLKNDFGKLVDYSFIAVVLVLLLYFRKIELVVVSSIPVLMSWIFTTGLMGMMGLQFNIINIIVCTLIFGIGVDYSIFMTTALQKEYTFGKKELPTYKASILLSVCTTILGIGVLVFAKHPALKSISIISIVGIISALLITFIIQPLIFNFLISNRAKNGTAPFRLRTLIHSILSFIYYGLGGFLLSIISVVLMKILPFPRLKKLRAFHYVMSQFMKSVLYTNPFATKKVINLSGEKFEQPSVIIANHTSFLDILAVGMLSPKIVFLVSDWVYNSPVFGKGVKLAGFYPVSQGLEGGVEHLREKVNQGFSLMVFPEGTRSETNVIHRFHKGAFYLAEQFNLDIVPVMIHGNSEVLPKGDFIIEDGKITVKILERIKPDDHLFGSNYTERNKLIARFFKDSFRNMRAEIETPDYFKRIVLNNFLYKDAIVVDAVKQEVNQKFELYHLLNEHIDTKANILRIANDYGVLDILLSLQEAQRKITCFIDDNSKQCVAQTNYSVRKRNIKYLNKTDEIFQQKYSVLILSASMPAVITASFLADINTVVLIDDLSFKDAVLNLGFEVTLEEHNQMIILKKAG
jgi:uncharacterized protein